MLHMNLWDKLLKIKWNRVTVYGAAQEENRMAFLTELSNFCSSSKEPTLIGGDFNLIRFVCEKNKNNRVHRHTDLFNAITHFHEFRELNMNGRMYTWSNNQENPTFEKLDRVLCTRTWENIFPLVLVKKIS